MTLGLELFDSALINQINYQRECAVTHGNDDHVQLCDSMWTALDTVKVITQMRMEIRNNMNTYELFWSPTGRKIGTVEARTSSSAKRKAPQPYRKYLGEIYTNIISVGVHKQPICISCKGKMNVNKPFQNICSEVCLENTFNRKTIVDEQIDDQKDGFSYSECDDCGSTLGGERWYRVRIVFGSDYNEQPKFVDGVCIDCCDAILE